MLNFEKIVIANRREITARTKTMVVFAEGGKFPNQPSGHLL